MGLAERFKDKLATRNIFQANDIEKSLENGEIQFISKPITKDITIQPKTIHNGELERVENLKDLDISIEEKKFTSTTKFEELETEIIDKIRKTPYWEDFSKQRQEKMISTYFDAKMKNEKYSTIGYTQKDKLEFIQNILALSNYR